MDKKVFLTYTRRLLGSSILWLLMVGLLSAQQRPEFRANQLHEALLHSSIGFPQVGAQTLGSLTTDDPYRVELSFQRKKAHSLLDSLGVKIQIDDYADQFPLSEQAFNSYLELGHREWKASNYEAAMGHYKTALNHDHLENYHDKLYYWLAEGARKLEQLELARTYYIEIANNHSRSPLAAYSLYAIGATYLMESEFDKAAEIFERLGKEHPTSPINREVGTALGEAYYQQRNFPEVITSLKRALPYLQDESKAKAVYLIAESYNFLNEYDNATTYYLQYINLKKGKDEERIAHYGLGWIYHKQKIYHWAAESFGKVTLKDDHLSRKALYYQAVNLKLSGNYEKALNAFETFRETFEIGYWTEQAYIEYAVALFDIGNYTRTIEILLDLVRSDLYLIRRGLIFSLLGEALFGNQEYTRASRAFEEAERSIDIDPTIKIQSIFQKGWVQFRNQAYKQSRVAFEQVRKEYPRSKFAGESLFWIADAYYNEEDYGPAGKYFKQFIEENPEHELVGAAYYSLGWSHFKMRRYEEANAAFSTFIQNYEAPPIALFPYDIDTYLRLGDSNYALSNYSEAIGWYSRAIGAEPGGDYALFMIGNAHYRAGETYDAVTTFRKLLRLYPYTRLREQANYNIAYVYFLMGNYDQAVAEFVELIRKYPNTPWAARAQYNIGDAYYNAGEFDQAVKEYKKVMDDHPRSDYVIDAVSGIQYALLASGQQDSSEVMLESFIQKFPSAKLADRLRFRQAETKLQSGDYAGAIKAFEDYLRVTTQTRLLPEAQFYIAEAHRYSGDIEKAMKGYEQVVKEYPSSEKSPTALSTLGLLALEQGEAMRALEYYVKLKADFPSYQLESYIGMGNAYLKMGRFEDARTTYQEGIQETARNSDALQIGLAKVLYREGKYQQASLKLLPIADENSLEPGAEARYLLGKIAQEQGNFNEALEHFSKVKVLYQPYREWVALALVASAECYRSLGNPVEAQKTLQSVLESFSSTPAAAVAEQLLNQ